MSRPGSASPTNPRCEHPGGGNDFTSTKAGSAELVGSVNIDPTPDVPAFHLIDRARTQVVPRTPITGGLGPDAAPVSPAQQHRMAGCTGVAGPQERGPRNIRRPRARNDAGDDVRTDAGQVDQHHQRGVNGFLVEPVGAGQCVEPGPQAGPIPCSYSWFVTTRIPGGISAATSRALAPITTIRRSHAASTSSERTTQCPDPLSANAFG